MQTFENAQGHQIASICVIWRKQANGSHRNTLGAIIFLRHKWQAEKWNQLMDTVLSMAVVSLPGLNKKKIHMLQKCIYLKGTI